MKAKPLNKFQLNLLGNYVMEPRTASGPALASCRHLVTRGYMVSRGGSPEKFQTTMVGREACLDAEIAPATTEQAHDILYEHPNK